MKIAIYTAIFGDKDEIKQPINYKKDDNVDYFLITDNEKSNFFNYEIIIKEPIYDDVTKNARYYKINGLEIFKNYDFVIWHDANLQIIHNKILSTLDFIQNNGIAFFKHAERNCIYDEAIKCIELEKDYPFKILKQIIQYYKCGIKNEIGLYDTSIVAKNNKLIYEEFLNLWWNEIKYKSRRDQLSLPYSLKEFKVVPGIMQGNRSENAYSLFHGHKHTKYNFLSIGKPKRFSSGKKKLAIALIKLIKVINK